MAVISKPRVLGPRWYAAVRDGYLYATGNREDVYEIAGGYRPGIHELIKLGFEIEHNATSGQISRSVMIQLVTTVHPITLAWH
jgi:hypothetical protein